MTQQQITQRLQMLYKLRKFRETTQLFQAHPDLMEVSDALVTVAKAYAKLLQIDAATDLFEQAIRLDPSRSLPKFEFALMTNEVNPERALALIKECIETNPMEPAYWGTLGNIHLNQDRYLEAIQAYQKSLELNPLEKSSIVNLGACHSELEEFDKAIYYFKKAIKLMPNDHAGYVNLAVTYSRQKQLEEAMSYYLEALRIYPNSANAIYGIACIHAMKNEKDMAFEHLKQTIALNPTFKETARKDIDFKLFWEEEEFRELTR